MASLLHDLGVTDRHFGKDERTHCFAVEGGFAAENFLQNEGLDPHHVECVVEAITLHINVMVEVERGPVAYYLNAGAWCDLVGTRVAEIPDAAARRVISRYPGLDILTMFSDFAMREAALRPESRVAATIETTGGRPPLSFPWAELEGDGVDRGNGPDRDANAPRADQGHHPPS